MFFDPPGREEKGRTRGENGGRRISNHDGLKSQWLGALLSWSCVLVKVVDTLH